MSEHDPRERIAYEGELEPVFARVGEVYHLGGALGHEVVMTGYEDLNVVLNTESGKHFAKVFSADRTPDEVTRFGNIMSAVLGQGVQHPDIYQQNHQLIYTDQESRLSMVVMKHVEGRTFYDTGQVPDDEELRQIMRQAVLINSVPIKPPFLYDSWAVQSLQDVFEPIKTRIPSEDAELIEGALTDFAGIDQARLPHCFVHGDLVKSNILKGDDSKIYILDFSVSNWYPRIQELAVIVGNLLNSEETTEPYLDTLKKAVKFYVSEGGELTEKEVKVLPAFARAASAAE